MAWLLESGAGSAELGELQGTGMEVRGWELGGSFCLNLSSLLPPLQSPFLPTPISELLLE